MVRLTEGLQKPAQVAHPDDRKASSVRLSPRSTATARASPCGVTPATVGADVEFRSLGNGGPMVSGTRTEPFGCRAWS